MLLMLLACTGKAAESATADPTVGFLAPEPGATVEAGEVPVTLLVEDFVLHDPTRHNEGVADVRRSSPGQHGSQNWK